MLMALLVLSAGVICQADELGYCSDRIVTYDITETNSVIKLNCKLGSVLTIEPPGIDKVEKTTLGNGAFFRVDMEDDQIAVWAKVPENSGLAGRDVINASTNLKVKLRSGRTLMLEMRITIDKGVELLKLRSPLEEKKHQEQKSLREQIRAEIEAKLDRRRENLDNEAHDRALGLISKHMARRLQCEELDQRARKGLLVVRGTMICHVGDYIVLKFQLHNRSRNEFRLQELQVFSVESERLNPLEAVVMWAEDRTPHLAFDKKASGAAVIPVAERISPEFAIRVIESGGKGREVTVDELEF